MFQIIIWMLCVYLVVKGFEILSQREGRTKLGFIGASIAWIAAPLFFALSLTQSMNVPGSGGASVNDETPADPNYPQSNPNYTASGEEGANDKYRKCLDDAFGNVSGTTECDRLHGEGKL